MFDVVARNLKKLRIENGYTQKQVSDYLGIAQSNLSKIENGERKFNITLLDKLCLLYNCSPEYLLGETDVREKSCIAFRSDEKMDLNVIAKMNEITGFLKLLRKLDEED
ncbi:helix-turn-helix domain-containing protein [Methanosphaera sp. BMS]|uniref:helix-turn-helix domain-containing protein n=1 Tax=Methanosphaera sp. BMS TaxID=1789762 RepID=UPI000DC1D7F5|nr:helix-turn-helix transcriptional regulator [Methanosphaera sp. BMS]AWX32006.1 XRE family transcriptional regulator [Methanosphaera sp. BMS]